MCYFHSMNYVCYFLLYENQSDQQRCNGIPKDDVVQEHFLNHDDSVGVALEQSALQQDYVFQFDDVSARSTQSNNQKESAVQIEVGTDLILYEYFLYNLRICIS